MNRKPIFPIAVVITIVVIPFIHYLFSDQNELQTPSTEQPVSNQEQNLNQSNNQDEQEQSGEQQNQEEQQGQAEGENNQQGTDEQRDDQQSNQEQQQNQQQDDQIVWGVDSASYTDQSMYECVKENFGQPSVWGRYLGTKEDVSIGLDQAEVELLHENDVRILVIYNHFNDARGYERGIEEAERAINMASELGIPNGVGLFADIEPSYPVDHEFIQGWYDTIESSNYQVGLYGVFDEGSELVSAYNATNQEAQENTVVWTAYPQKEITTKENAPSYAPQGPDASLLYGWQYAIESEKCNIDTNLFQQEINEYLW
ncbi:glycoside hydrolase domain-containing protein [Aquibacillus sediminis]|uniref:glycoside hydrolase domain-containing protein n=1 Tax=Aquibacillus sediminis TaxID=2574734 RepID=UPI001FEA06C2|nr:glycoside hydrolase domain-containing protein [Aquibacillus sediminis]